MHGVALLARLIDHAPMFPPASLPLEEALAEDERARASRVVVHARTVRLAGSGLDVCPDSGAA